jgi:uncharacterized membrane protein YgdD (TMEM256/DUF423 family)
VSYQMLLPIALVFLGLYLDELLTCMHVGGLLVALRVLLCGRLYLFVFYGVFGGKGFIKVLKISRGR